MPLRKSKSCDAYEEPFRSRASDYAFAHFRQCKGRRHPDLRDRYEFARKLLVDSVSTRREKSKRPLADEFAEHLARWKRETGHLSSLTKAMAHPSYQRIIGLAKESPGHEIERLLLNELAAEPDHWFQALTAITGENPLKPEDDFDASVAAWLDWGKSNKII